VNQPKSKGRGDATPLKSHRWKKGQSGNPSGKPKGTLSLVAMLRKALQDDPEKCRAIIENLMDNAAHRPDEKSLAFIREILDRIDGKPAQTIQGPDGGPIEIDVRWQPWAAAEETDEET
jgi:hypothetical protein